MSGLRFLLASWRWFRAGYVNEPEQRSHRLLRDWLSAEQRAQYDRHGHFEVVGCHSGRRYLIKHGTASNIIEQDKNGRPVMGWCFVPRDNLASGDVMLAQKIALETDELGALKIARSLSSWVPPERA
jgi:hypothetical protein